jgi:hypothetical protein
MQAVGAFLFQHPHNLGTLFIQELCAEDPPKKWHAKAADRTATNGAPVGLIAFAGVAVGVIKFHMVFCSHRMQHRYYTAYNASVTARQQAKRCTSSSIHATVTSGIGIVES